MQRLVVGGSLPCSKEEAAILAGMQLRLEECWPRSRPPRLHHTGPAPSPAAPNTPNDSASIPLLSDRSNPSRSLATTSGGGGGGGTDYPIELRADAELHADDPPPTAAIKRSGMGRAVSLLTTCYSSSEDNEMSLSASARIDDLVPPCFVHAGNMPRLIK
ncbi:hypothetical protein Fcan01_19496, partial [Folsomia candida]